MASLYGLNAQTAITELTFVLVWRQKGYADPGKIRGAGSLPLGDFRLIGLAHQRQIFLVTTDIGRDVRTERDDFQPIGAGGFERGARQHTRDAPALQRGRYLRMVEGDALALALVGEDGDLALGMNLVLVFRLVIDHRILLILAAHHLCSRLLSIVYCLFRLESCRTVGTVAERFLVGLPATAERHPAILAQ